MNELPRIAEWLYSVLGPVATAHGLTHSAGAGTRPRAREGVAAAGWAFPSIIYQLQSPGSDLSALEGRLWATPLYLVKVIGRVASWGTLAPIADDIDAALHKARGLVEGRRIEASRESPFSLIEHPDNVEFRHLGGLYRIRIG